MKHDHWTGGCPDPAEAACAQDLRVVYRPPFARPKIALVAASLRLKRGVSLGVVGPNGAGKTTLLRALAGLIRPDRGEARVLGLDPVVHRPALMRRVGVLLSGARHFPDRWNVGDALRFVAAMHGVPPRRVGELVEAFGLVGKEKEPLSALSLGNRQRLNLAVVFVHDPELVLLDEPTLALDAQTVEAFAHFLRERLDRGMSAVITSHDHAVLGKLVDDVLLLDQGITHVPRGPVTDYARMVLVTDRPVAFSLPAEVWAEGNRLELPNDPRLVVQLLDRLDLEGIRVMEMRTQTGVEVLARTRTGGGL